MSDNSNLNGLIGQIKEGVKLTIAGERKVK